VGQSSFRKDQEKLVQRMAFKPDLDVGMSHAWDDNEATSESGETAAETLVDILICTPGKRCRELRPYQTIMHCQTRSSPCPIFQLAQAV